MMKEGLYEVEFESLSIKEIEVFENKNTILNAKVDVSVTLGKCKKSIKDILSLKDGDIICLDKNIDEDLDINVNDKCIAKGESIKIEDKISIRINNYFKGYIFLRGLMGVLVIISQFIYFSEINWLIFSFKILGDYLIFKIMVLEVIRRPHESLYNTCKCYIFCHTNARFEKRK